MSISAILLVAGFTESYTVPDFRSSNGLFNTLKSENRFKPSGKQLFDASVYRNDDSTTSFHEMVRTLSKVVSNAKPTAFHEMLATLANEGRLQRLYTQNVDGIDTSLPPLATSVPLDTKGPWPRTVQLHGSLEKMVCSKCNTFKDFDPLLFDGPVPPLCVVCEDLDKIRTENAGKRSHGIGRLRPRMVLYNEDHPDSEAIGLIMRADLRARPDAVIVVGTSMEIKTLRSFVKLMCPTVRGRRDGVAIWINRSSPPVGKDFENLWDLVVSGDCDEVAHRVNLRRWNDEGNDYKECTESEAELAKQKDTQVKVIVKTAESKSSMPMTSVTPKKGSTPTMMMTPAESPKFKSTNLPPIPFVFPPLKEEPKKTSKPPQKITKKKSGPKKSNFAPGTGSGIMSKVSIQPAQANIKGTFKVTKHTSASAAVKIPTTPKKYKPEVAAKPSKPPHPSPTGPEKARRLLESINEPIPMAPLSPHSAKSNGPLTPTAFEPLPLKIAKVEVPIEIEITGSCIIASDGERLKKMSEEIVSPIGGVPSGMANILHT